MKNTYQVASTEILGLSTGFLVRIHFFTGNSIPGTGWGHSFAGDYADPSHHFAQESPQPWNLISLEANAIRSGRTFLSE